VLVESLQGTYNDIKASSRDHTLHRRAAPPPRGKPAAPVKLVDDQFVTVDGEKPVVMHGLNWFGFNNGMTALNGLWAGGKSGNSDFATIAYELQLLVRAVRAMQCMPAAASKAERYRLCMPCNAANPT